jgi:outer membrane protein
MYRAICRTLFAASLFLAAGLGIVGLTAAGDTTFAQQPDSSKEILSLADLIQRAITNSSKIAADRSDLAATLADVDQVSAAYYPQLETIIVTGPVSDATRPKIVGDAIVDTSPDVDDFKIGVFGRLDVTLTQPLYTFGKLSNRKNAAQYGFRAQKQNIFVSRNEIVLQVKQLYYALVLAREGMDAADESDDYFDDAAQRIKRLLKLGSLNVDQSDLYKIDAYRADTKRFRAQAENGEQVAYFALKRLIDYPPSQEFDISATDLPTAVILPSSQNEYIAKAIAKRPELKGLDQGLLAQKSLVEAAKSDRYPSFFLMLKGSFAGAPGRDSFDQAYFSDEFNHAYAGFVAGMKWDFDFGIGKARIGKARAQYQKLHHLKRFAQKNIPIQVFAAYQDVRQWQTSVQASQDAAKAARKWLITAFSNFDMGIGTAKNIFDALDKYGHHRGNYIEALYNYNLSLAQLDYAIGASDEN